MTPNNLKWLLPLGLVFGLGVAWAQGQVTTPPSSKAEPASQQDSAATGDTETGAESKTEVPPEPAAVEIDEVPEVPKEILEAIDKQDEVHATMERFVPTEKLSEDRAVAFPNDI